MNVLIYFIVLRIIMSCESKPNINPRDYNVILAEFSNGSLKHTKKNNLKYTSYRKCKDNSAVLKRYLVAKSNRLTYSGRNFKSDTPKITSTTLKVCVVNKKSCSVNFYDADLFHLKPFIKCPEIEKIEEKSFIERSSDLTLEFGSKTKKKLVNSRKRYGTGAVNSDSTSLDNSLAAASEVIENINELTPTSEINSVSIIPPQNSSATNVEDVYDIFNIISKEEYEALDSEAIIFMTVKHEDIQKWKTETKYSDFIIQYLQNNLYSMNLHKAKLLCYIHFMFCFLKTQYADWRKKDPVPNVPQPFKQKLMDLFTIKKSMPQRMKDKLFAYTLVVALILNNYILNANVLSTTVKFSSKRMETIAYALGCHISGKKGDVKIIQLKLPLFKYQPLSKYKKK